MKKTIFIFVAFLPFMALSQEFSEDTVAIGHLKGTLTTPSASTNTAALIIAGSGPTDRNGNNAMGMTNNSLRLVAEALTNSGFAVLRYDKRGIAASAKAVQDPASMRFEHFVEDAVSWLNLLREKGYEKLVVIGHSQGSLVGMMAAAQQPAVVAFVSIAGAAEDAGTVIVNQIAAQSTELAKDAEVNLDSLRKGFSVKSYSPYLTSIFNPQIQDFLRSYILYDPSQEIKELSIPVLFVNGTTDIQVGPDQAEKLKAAYPQGELLIIEGMNHVLKDAPSDDLNANMMTYSNPELPLSEGLMSGIINFLKSF